MRFDAYACTLAVVRRAMAPLCATLGVLSLPVAALRAQSAPPDRSVERAVRDFERFRHQRLPIAYGDHAPCEERVGRFCYWLDAGREMPDEPDGVAAARRRLIDSLGSAQSRAPENGWLAGQRVRYLIEAGDAPAAYAAARECEAERWWCAALRGTALHAAERVADAAAAFDSALAAAPDSARCHLTDVSPWLDGDERDAFLRRPCPDESGARDSAAAALWHAADPFGGRETSEARVVFLTRRITAALLAAGARTDEQRWGDDMEELGLRYGFASRWELERSGSLNDPWSSTVIGHEPQHTTPFAPHGHAIARFPVAGADTVLELQPRATRFRRGDSLLVVVAYDASAIAASTGGARSVRAAAALVAAAPARAVRARADQLTGAFVLTTGRGGGAVYVDAVDTTTRRATRGQSTVAPLDLDAAVSDLLLVQPERVRGRPDVPLDSIVDAVDARGAVRAGDPFAIYWEAYRAPTEADSLRVELRIVPTTLSLAARLAAALRLRQLPEPSTIVWSSPPRPDAGDGHALVVDTTGLPPGGYRVELWLRGRGPDAMTSADLRIVR